VFKRNLELLPYDLAQAFPKRHVDIEPGARADHKDSGDLEHRTLASLSAPVFIARLAYQPEMEMGLAVPARPETEGVEMLPPNAKYQVSPVLLFLNRMLEFSLPLKSSATRGAIWSHCPKLKL
jgi:hypothetical protein